MQWYLSKIVFQIICGNGDHTAQFDEQLRLVGAVDEEEAFMKATEMGENEEDRFFNHKQQLVQWKFIAVKELQEVQLGNGTLLFSQVKENTAIASPVWATVDM